MDEVTRPCANPLCERRVQFALYCCLSCEAANAGHYEIHEDGPLAHSAMCEERERLRLEHTEAGDAA